MGAARVDGHEGTPHGRAAILAQQFGQLFNGGRLEERGQREVSAGQLLHLRQQPDGQ